MKCRDCNCARKGYFCTNPDAYACIGVKEPFEIFDYPNAECRAYRREKGRTAIKDGVYIELFAVKDGVRYNEKILNIKDVSTILTSSLMDGIEKLCT